MRTPAGIPPAWTATLRSELDAGLNLEVESRERQILRPSWAPPVSGTAAAGAARLTGGRENVLDHGRPAPFAPPPRPFSGASERTVLPKAKACCPGSIVKAWPKSGSAGSDLTPPGAPRSTV